MMRGLMKFARRMSAMGRKRTLARACYWRRSQRKRRLLGRLTARGVISRLASGNGLLPIGYRFSSTLGALGAVFPQLGLGARKLRDGSFLFG